MGWLLDSQCGLPTVVAGRCSQGMRFPQLVQLQLMIFNFFKLGINLMMKNSLAKYYRTRSYF
jgi:hypothetical protein